MAVISTRMSVEEENAVKKAASKYNLSLSDYMRVKLLDQNIDLIEGASIKYIAPHEAMHKYLAINIQVKTLLILKRLFQHQGIMNEDEFAKFDRENTQTAKGILAQYQYRKIESPKLYANETNAESRSETD